MFACQKGEFLQGKINGTHGKCSRLKQELVKLKRPDIIHVLNEQANTKGIQRVLELHGREYMLLRINRADVTTENHLIFRICFNIVEEVRKYQKLLISSIQFADEIILFHSLNKHFKMVQTLLSDYALNKTIKYEPTGSRFEILNEVSVHYVENIKESFIRQLSLDKRFRFQLLRFNHCNIKEQHFYAMKDLLVNTEKLDLSGNETIPPKALHILSNGLLQANVSLLKLLNLSSCNLSDNHLIDLQPVLHLVEQLDLSYNEELMVRSMKVITNSIHVTYLAGNGRHSLKKLTLAGCSLTDDHVKQLYHCINYLDFLDLSGNVLLTPEAMKVISEAVIETGEIKVDAAGETNLNGKTDKEIGTASNNRLKVLRLENCGLTEHHLEMLSECIPLLIELDLSWNVLSVESVQFIEWSVLQFIKKHSKQPYLEILNLAGCELTNRHMSEVHNCFMFIRDLHIGYNKAITSESIEKLVNEINLIGDAAYLNNLDISGIQINETALYDLLGCANNLKALDLSLCKLSIDHLYKFQNVSINNLTELHLRDNQNLSPDAMKVISDTIVNGYTRNNKVYLKILDLQKCRLEDAHIENLQHCIRYLEKLDLSFNSLLTPKALKTLSKSVTSIRDGFRSSVLLGDDESIIISSGRGEQSLKELCIASCGFKDSHFVNLCGCFAYLEKLDISANNLTYISLLAIRNEIINYMKQGRIVQLQELNVYQAFCLRDYHYRKLELDLKPCGVDVICVI